jgi:uncharacterized protein involved in exopolysaccharide biosynthesis
MNTRVLDALLKRKWTVISTTLAGLIIAATAAVLTTPVYRSQVVLAPTEIDQNQRLTSLATQFGGLVASAGLRVGSQSNRNEAIATLKSRSLTVSFIEEQDLLPLLFAESWDDETGSWDVDDPGSIPTISDGFKIFDEKIRTVVEDPKSGMVILSVEWTDRKLAAQWANLLVNRVNQQMRGRAKQEAEESIKYLNQELERTSIMDLQSAIFRLIEVQISEIVMANVRQEYAFRVIDVAAVSDEDDHIKPRTLLMLVLGFLLGGIFGVLAVMLRHGAVSIE